MTDFGGKTPVVVSMRHPFPGAQRTLCDECQNYVFEHPKNILLVREHQGFVICEVCAVLLKMENPEIQAKQQLWNGEIREFAASGAVGMAGQVFKEMMGERWPTVNPM